MKTQPLLLPAPRRLIPEPGMLNISQRQVKDFLADLPRAGGVTSHVNPALIAQPQGYRLIIRPTGITMLAHDDAGEFYARIALRQLVRQFGEQLPCMRIEDWPDFPTRGYMLDISRDRVPTMQYLFQLVDLLAELKYNQLQLYTEHTFAYKGHEVIWRHADPMTPAQVRQLDKYCIARHIELVANQNSFGHMDRWLNHPNYHDLAEVPQGSKVWWTDDVSRSVLCPGDPRALALIADLMDQLLPNFTSNMVNIGCDETFDLGKGRSAKVCGKRGKTRVYLDFLRKLHKLIRSHERTMQFWGDIIFHHPELIAELPSDVIALEWGYEANSPYNEHAAKFAAAGVPFYVCPGTSSWNSWAGRTNNTIGNLTNAAEQGLKHGAIGFLLTDWGNAGHYQPPSVSWLPLGMGAGACWHLPSNPLADIHPAVNLHIFRDQAGVIARIFHDLGNAYSQPGKLITDGSVLAPPICPNPRFVPQWLDEIPAEKFAETRAYIRQVMRNVGKIRMNRIDAELVIAELKHAAAMLEWTCDLNFVRRKAADNTIDAISSAVRKPLASRLTPLIADQRVLWLKRSRQSELELSAGRFEKLRDVLQA